MLPPNLKQCYEAHYLTLWDDSYIVTRKMSQRAKVELKPSRWVRLRTMTLEAGLEYLREPRQDRKIRGQWVESTGTKAKTRLKMFKSGQTSCVKCGLQGSHWHIERHASDKVMPFSINLYAMRGYEEVMLTHDHILPASMGGSNHLSNAQCMCEPCNHRKGDKMKLKDLLGVATHRDIVNMFKVVTQPLTPNLRKTIRLAKTEFTKTKDHRWQI